MQLKVSSFLTLSTYTPLWNFVLKFLVLNLFYTYRQGTPPPHPLRAGPFGASLAGSRRNLFFLVSAPSASLNLYSITRFRRISTLWSAPHGPLRVIPLEDSLAGVGGLLLSNFNINWPSLSNFPDFGDMAPPPSDQFWTSRFRASVRDPFPLNLEGGFGMKQGTPPIPEICVNCFYSYFSISSFQFQWSS